MSVDILVAMRDRDKNRSFQPTLNFPICFKIEGINFNQEIGIEFRPALQETVTYPHFTVGVKFSAVFGVKS